MATAKCRTLVKVYDKITYRLRCEEEGKKKLAEVVGICSASSFDFVVKAASPSFGFKSTSVSGKRRGACGWLFKTGSGLRFA